MVDAHAAFPQAEGKERIYALLDRAEARRSCFLDAQSRRPRAVIARAATTRGNLLVVWSISGYGQQRLFKEFPPGWCSVGVLHHAVDTFDLLL